MTIKRVEVIAWAHEIAKSEKRTTTEKIREPSAINSIDRSTKQLHLHKPINSTMLTHQHITAARKQYADADAISKEFLLASTSTGLMKLLIGKSEKCTITDLKTSTDPTTTREHKITRERRETPVAL
jgi:predicted RecB family nuclease